MKDLITKDLGIFLNPEEFGQLHDVNGRQVLIVFDADILKERASYRDVPTDGVFTGQVVVFIKSTDLPSMPATGSVLRLDGKMYLVNEVSESMGILEITLEANET